MVFEFLCSLSDYKGLAALFQWTTYPTAYPADNLPCRGGGKLGKRTSGGGARGMWIGIHATLPNAPPEVPRRLQEASCGQVARVGFQVTL